MPPTLALVFSLLLSLFLFKKDTADQSRCSKALWLPLILLLIAGSRPISLWLDPAPATETTLLDGSPLDRTVFLLLIFGNLIVLLRRGKSSIQVLRRNWIILVFFLYCGVSVLWSDFPLVAFKRWIKSLGLLLAVIVVLTEREPKQAFQMLIRRTAFVLIPLSIVLIKYYPYLGRSYASWTGQTVFVGVTTNRGALGSLCLLTGVVLISSLMSLWQERKSGMRGQMFLYGILMVAIFWLFFLSNSVTTIAGLLIAIFLFVVCSLKFFRKNRSYVLVFLGFCALSCLIGEATLGLLGEVIAVAGRDSTLTGRTELWDDLLAMQGNPLFGAGFQSFWLGERLETMQSLHWWAPNHAHNGYLEVYLNLGWIGVVLLLAVIGSAYRGSVNATDSSFGIIRLILITTTVMYNVTSVSFDLRMSLPSLVFLLVACKGLSLHAGSSVGMRTQQQLRDVA